ncbi:MAG: type I restriction endonuclease subunit R [Candidatus Pacearchaeota archaeon]
MSKGLGKEMKITESELEEHALDLLQDQGYKIINGYDISPEGKNPERKNYREVVLVERLKKAIDKLNPDIPESAKEEAIKKVLRVSVPNQIIDNQQFHKLLTEGVPVEFKKKERVVGDSVKLIDFENPEKNEFLAINQFTIIEDKYNRRPDILLFVNGLPLVIFELKNIAEEKADINQAFQQLQNYKTQISSLFRFNEILIISDGMQTEAGTLSSDKDRFMPWKSINGKIQETGLSLEILIKGMLNKETLLDLIQNFIVFEKEKELIKKLGAYHQYNAVNKALNSTIKATKGNHRAGVVWHTQGSGKSLSMVFYASKLAVSKELENPTIVVLTDRNDLDEQLFSTFSRCSDLLRQKPENAESRKKIQELLKRSSGGIIFTTIQKFFPEEGKEEYSALSNRNNIVVIADEAHRTQYGFSAHIVESKKNKEMLIKYGYAKYLRDALPNASFIGFTGTPIEKADRSTPAVFGEYIDKYDIKQAVDDGATVKLLYESRLAKLGIKPEERRKIDPLVEEVSEDEELKSKMKSKWARMEKVVGSPERIKRIAKDIVEHFEERIKILDGKAMIVAMSRRICVDLYNEIISLRPEWHNSDDKKGIIKVIMTGSSSDKSELQPHIRNKKLRENIGERLKDPKDELKIVIVRDMWLTGFDAPCVNTMYIDKPMKAHGLMQAIARANRKYKTKEAGLIVDYLGIGKELKDAVMQYTASGGKGKPIFDQKEAVKKMLEKYEIVKDMFHGFDYKIFFKLDPRKRISVLPDAINYILKGREKLKERFIRETTALLSAFSLSVPNEKAMKIKEEVGFFQVIKSAIIKMDSSSGTSRTSSEFDSVIKQIISKAVISDRIIDIFEAAGIEKPDISILSEKFLIEVKDMPQKNLAFEALKKLLQDEIRIITKKNVVLEKSFMEMLEKTIKKYTNKSIEAAQAIQELIELAHKIKEEQDKGKVLGLTNDEKAFYDALADCKEAMDVLGNKQLRIIALELWKMIQKSVKIDWTMRESVQADLRLKVKKILKRYGYPPSGQEHAIQLVLNQAHVIAGNLAETF